MRWNATTPRWRSVPPFGGACCGYAHGPVSESPLSAHAATPRELSERIAAERGDHAFLLYRDGDGNQVILPLIGDRATIGRRMSNEVALDWDSEVSRVHA